MVIQTRLDTIVHVYNEALLSHDGYRHLAAVINVKIFNIDQDINQINDHDSDVNTGGKNPVIISEDTFYIKLAGDGYNVRRKQNHVMITFCLLNKKNNVLKPDHQYSICLYIGKEKYKTLDKVSKIFAVQLADLKESEIIDGDGIHWPIKFYFSGD
ncbi:hypothetical protein GLOIN_2v1761837 [Rhizophagus irregularis DAOM 181602=DAOM 197198]|uniref:Uncharacterized protein n=1 Tax=Rhizophagus irregularis (strain DAOM 181602 / DAOM 197198 / MUCL 43194) TaxID=747089 RepID=A0A2P4QZ26_RHIID|nr:hypothetical protein GLOIN_2v1761837 [Rhizophagus irregularis DAOM 181602=DAOM 197198]POG82916.1 hypothetical protein GLOIN_2v1761837 [Rhizophagus irregularis DAOM 181602=DAOM 197198]|eukprot:XP_025189782.1 hypothetical protein GLOIN_2v1761837 [Rhizophagus irregularis DAOM 181602=DAOM 197198]